MLTNLDRKTQDKNSKLGGIVFRLMLAAFSAVDIFNFPKAENATIKKSPLLDGEKFKYIDLKPSSIKVNAAPGESPYGNVLIVEAILEGITKETLEWIYKNKGEDFLVVWERCSDGVKFIAGSPCSGGLKLSAEDMWELDDKTLGVKLKFTAGECIEPYWFYEGEVQMATASGASIVVPTDAATTAKNK